MKGAASVEGRREHGWNRNVAEIAIGSGSMDGELQSREVRIVFLRADNCVDHI
jgi:hypothetical protein